MTDEEMDRFTTNLREVLLFIKYSKDKAKLNDMLNHDERFRTLDRRAASPRRTSTLAGCIWSTVNGAISKVPSFNIFIMVLSDKIMVGLLSQTPMSCLGNLHTFELRRDNTK